MNGKLTGLVIALLGASLMPAISQPVTLVQKGKAVGAILLPANATERLRASAQELQSWLREMTGATLPIASWQPQLQGVVLAPATAFPQQAKRMRLAELGNEEFAIVSDGRQVWLLGNTDLAVQHAVFAFLEALGRCWFFFL